MLLWRRSSTGRVSGRASASRMSPSAAATRTTQNTARQPPSAITPLPASGARIGEMLKTSIRSDMSFAASGPVWRSRTTARGTTVPAQAPRPWTKTEGDEPFDGGCQRAADAADHEQHEADIQRQLAPEHVGKRAVDELAGAERHEEDHEAHLHLTDAGAEIGADGRQGRQIHIDGEGSDRAEQAQHDREADERRVHDRRLSNAKTASGVRRLGKRMCCVGAPPARSRADGCIC